MAVNIVCDTCGYVGSDTAGWLFVSCQFISYNPDPNIPASGRQLDSTAPDLCFHQLECREAWCQKADLTDPGLPVKTNPIMVERVPERDPHKAKIANTATKLPGQV